MSKAVAAAGRRLPKESDAFDFMRLVRDALRDEEGKYEEFLSVMKGFNSKRINTEEVVERINVLFRGHHDLLLGFNAFLPEGHSTTVEKRHNGEVCVKFSDGNVRQMVAETLARWFDEEISIEKVLEEVTTLLREHPNVLSEAMKYLSKISSMDPVKMAASVVQFLNEAKPIEEICYHCLNYGTENNCPSSDFDDGISKPEQFMTSHKKDIKHKMAWTNLENCEDNRYPIAAANDDNVTHQDEEHINSFEVVGDSRYSCGDGNTAKKHSSRSEKSEEKVKKKKVNNDDEREKNRDYSSEGVKETESLDSEPSFVTENPTGFSVFQLNKENFVLPMPVSEVDLSNCEHGTPNYRLLPQNDSLTPSSYRTELCEKVLNYTWVLVPSGTEGDYFKTTHKNQYEKILFACEDDRFELDLLLGRVENAIQQAHCLLKREHSKQIKSRESFCIDDHFTVPSLRIIERIYGDHGLDIVDEMRKNVRLVLPIVLERLKQKQVEWSMSRLDFNKLWANVYSRNHCNSRDLYISAFKEQDEKRFCEEALLAELKASRQKTRKDEDAFLAIAIGNWKPTGPDMEVEFIDTAVHEDLYRIIKCSAVKLCSSEDQADKAMKAWSSFLAPIVGVVPRPFFAEKNGMCDPTACVPENCHADFAQSDGNSGRYGCFTTEKQFNFVKHMGGIISEEQSSSCKSCCVSNHTGYKGDDFHISQALREKSNLHGRLFQVDVQNHKGNNGEPPACDSITLGRTQGLQDCDGTICARVAKSTNEGILGHITEFSDHHDSYSESHQNHIEVDENEKEHSAKESCGKDYFNDSEELTQDSDVNRSYDGNLYHSVIRECNAQAPMLNAKISFSSRREVWNNNSINDLENSAVERQDLESLHEDIQYKNVSHQSDPEPNANCSYFDVSENCENGNVALPSQVFTEQFLAGVKPLTKHVPLALHDKELENANIFYGNDETYSLFRLYQILYERILYVKKNTCSIVNSGGSKMTGAPDRYSSFMKSLFELLDGSIDNTKFEDACCTFIGAQSYVLFTLDKLLLRIVKQLQVVALDSSNLLQLYTYEMSRQPGKFDDLVYHLNAQVCLPNASLFRFESKQFSVSSCISIKLLENRQEQTEVAAISMDSDTFAYLHNVFLSDIPDAEDPRGRFLMRNKRKCARKYSNTDIMEGVQINNNLEFKIPWNSSMGPYVLDTEDIFYRTKRQKICFRQGSICHKQAN